MKKAPGAKTGAKAPGAAAAPKKKKKVLGPPACATVIKKKPGAPGTGGATGTPPKAGSAAASAKKKPVAGGLKGAKRPAGAQAQNKGVKEASVAKKERLAREAKEAAAATQIQAMVRGKLARLMLGSMRAKQAAMEEEMEELRHKAWLAQVEYERKQEAKRRKRDAEERARRKAEAAARVQLLEAAYDDEVDELEQALATTCAATGRKLVEVEAEDASGNTALSEAAAGGAEGALARLLELGADPNRKGQYGRTPLWRACFMAKLACVRLLLSAGADPQLSNDEGELPTGVAATDEIKSALADFDPKETERLITERAERAKEAAALRTEQAQAAESALESAADGAERAADISQRELRGARAELARLIEEHDLMVTEGTKRADTIELTLQAIHDAEARVEACVLRATETAEASREAVAALSSERARNRGEADAHADELDAAEDDSCLRCDIGGLNDLLFREGEGARRLKEAAGGRWPLLVDPSGQSSVFLTYADSNFVQLCNPSALEPNKLRRGLLGAIRYGKPFVLDSLDVDMYAARASLPAPPPAPKRQQPLPYPPISCRRAGTCAALTCCRLGAS